LSRLEADQQFMTERADIHDVMSRYCLCVDQRRWPELAELFEDTGKTYLQIAERISDRCLSRLTLED